ncbi:root meristem growth factor 10 [Argentina anserina]|uniref:root meristem growth factor 10 n=1 Tax=Argentina anserina TaxID=57926 RepID=UPI0021764948|nr:root meristem growth factor 10 [Potentilla anserina]
MSTCSGAHQCPLYLFLLLLCLLSLHACSARRLAAVDDPKKSTKSLHFTNKGNDVNITGVPKVESFSSSKAVLEVTEGSEIKVDTEANSDDSTKEEGPKQYYTTAAPNVSSRKRKISSSSLSGADQKTKMRSDQHVSVSWRLPKKKRGIQKQPGFNLDYSPPKTHPPSHN